MNLENKRVKIDIRFISKRKPYIWDFYHYFINWCDSYTKSSTGLIDLTILKDYNSYALLFHKSWDNVESITLICNNYHKEHFRKLKRFIRDNFKRNSPRFEKPRDFDKINIKEDLKCKP